MNHPRTAVVSGGSSGIGRALVVELDRLGWGVFTCGRDPDKLTRLQKELPRVKAMVCDVTDRNAIRSFAEAVSANSPTVDLVISNAGGLHEIDFTREDLSSVDLTQELRVNTEGAIHLIAEFLPALRAAAPSSILMVSSGYALAPATRAPVYSASKAALHSLAKSLRRQLAPLSISVTELLPPVVDTPAVSHRRVKKLQAGSVAGEAIRGVFAGSEEVRPGPTKFLPAFLRLLPRTAELIVSKT